MLGMDKKVVEGTSVLGRTLYITRAGGLALVMVTIMEDDPAVAFLHDLIVESHCRGIGLGNQLLRDACFEAWRQGAGRIKLMVQPQSWMEEWYERNGFQFTGFGPLNGHMLAIMEKDLTGRESVEPQMS